MADGPLKEIRRGFPTFIHQDTELTGTLTSKSAMRIQGTVNGNVACANRLILDETGQLNGDVQATHIQIVGNASGKLEASDQLELLAPCRVHATIESPKLHIDPGVEFEGECRTFNQAEQRVAEKRNREAES